MTPEQHARIQEIFQEVIELPAPKRNEYLDAACSGDAELRSYVVNLIEADEVTESIDGPFDRLPGVTVKECPECKRCYDTPIIDCPDDGQRLDHTLPGTLLIDHKYRIQRLIGRGGMGAVYLVNHIHLNKRFALKLISAEGAIPETRIRFFETEAKALGQLKHPNIVQVTDYGVDPRGDGLPYLVMEYLEGRTVRDLADQHNGVLPFPIMADVLRQVAEGVDAAHAQDIVHGDLKPANLFLAEERATGETAKILDFGLARLLPPRQGEYEDQPTVSGSSTTAGIRGTPSYIAPELFQGQEASGASDLYALGVIAYQLLTGVLPFGRQPHIIMSKQRDPPPAPSEANSGLPPELDLPVQALLDLVPAQRPRTAVGAIAALESSWLAAQQREWRKREIPRRLLMSGIGTAAAVLLASLGAGLRVGQLFEDRTQDARYALLPSRAPDPRLMIVALDEDTLSQNAKPLAQWDSEFAHMISGIFGSGASALAIDLLLPGNWSLSGEFNSAVAAHAGNLALAKFTTETGGVIGTECISPALAFAVGPERVAGVFGFVNLDEDPDGGIRRMHIAYRDREGKEQPSFAARAVLAASTASPRAPAAIAPEWIDYSSRPSEIPQIPWKDVNDRLRGSPRLFENRIVFIGADYSGSNDVHRVPSTVSAGPVPGATIQALIANTILDHQEIQGIDPVPCMAVIAAACFVTFVLALRFPHRPQTMLGAGAATFFAYAVLALVLFRLTRLMLPVTGPELAVGLTVFSAWILKSRLAPYPLSRA